MSDKVTRLVTQLEAEGVTEIKNDFKAVGAAAEEAFGIDGTKAADKFRDEIEAIQNAAEKVTSKISAGRAITNRDVGAMGFAFDELKRDIDTAFGSVDKAPEKLRTAFKIAEVQIEQTKDTVRRFRDTQQEFNTELAEGGEKWTGMGDAINKALGPMGKMQAQMALTAAAFTEGWQAGMRFNTFVGTDMSEWNKTSESWGKTLKGWIENVSDGFVKLGEVAKAAWNLLKNPGDKSAIDEFNRAIKETRDVFTGTEEPVYKVRAATAALTKEQIAAAEAAKKHAEEQKQLLQKLDSTFASLVKLNAELAKQAGAAHDAELSVISSTSQLGYYERSLQSAQTALEAQKAKVAEVAAMWGEGSLAVKAATEEQQRLQQAVDSAQRSVSEESAKVSASEAAQKSAESAAKSLTEQKKKLEEQLKEERKAFEDGLKPTTDAATAVQQVATASDQASKSIAAIGSTKLEGALTSELTDVVKVLDEIIAKAGAAKKAMDSLANAGSEEAGGDGIDHSKASSDTMSWTAGGKPSMRSSGFGVTKP